jgi:hypothetical protein
VTIYRLTPNQGVPVLRQSGSIKGATSRGLREFPGGLRAVEPLSVSDLVALAATGVPLPVAARHLLAVHKAVQREKAKAAARVEAIRDKAREKVRAERQEEADRKAALKAQEKADRAAERKRKVAAERRAKKKAEKLQQAVQPEAAVLDPTDNRLPWEE